MIWSRLSLVPKLFIVIVTPVLLAVLLIFGATSFSVRTGFSQYLLEAELARLDDLVDRLENSTMANWQTSHSDRDWADVVRENAPRPPGRPGFPPGRPLHERLALITQDGKVVAGRNSANENFVTRPVSLTDGTAELRLWSVSAVDNAAARKFVAQQMRSLTMIATLALAVAAGLAWLTSGQILRPLRQIGAHVGRLAAGDLTARLPEPRNRDEVSQLMQDQNQLADSLSAAQKRERQWVSDTSHELKTPLAIMRAQVEAMQDGIRPMDPAALDTLHSAIMRLSLLTDDLSLLSRGETSCVLRETVDLRGLAQQATRDMAPIFERAGLVVTTNLQEDVMVTGDARRLRQVFDNLLNNALHYTQSPGRVDLRLYRSEGMAVAAIDDSAPCPPPEAMPRLFERFMRVESSRARTYGGSGLGLSICRTLIEAHGGNITAEPSDLGGVCIRILLPLKDAADD